MRLLPALLATLAVCAAPVHAETNTLDDRDAAGTLREFVMGYLSRHSDSTFPVDKRAKILISKTALGPRDPDGYVIYINGGGWCGSGGCYTLIVSKVDNRFQPLGFVPATQLPIFVERPSGSGADVEFVVTVRGLGDGRAGDGKATLTRRTDAYDFYQPQRPIGAEGSLELLISETAPEVRLY